MSYLVASAYPAELKIGTGDYVNNLLSFTAQDASAFRTGLITTVGQIKLGSLPGQNLADYDRNDFKRGTRINLKIRYPSGRIKIHPRGDLYVISTAYLPEREELLIECGCLLVIKKLLEETETLLPMAPIPLDPAQQDFPNISASIAAAGKIAWADSNGLLAMVDFFEGDGFGGVAASKFVAMRGVTTLGVTPLAAAQAIPDEILLSYQYPKGTLADDNQGRVDTTTTTSRYFLRYPATTFDRFRLKPIQDVVAPPPIVIPPVVVVSSGCGNTPPPPPVNIDVPAQPAPVTPVLTCNYGYETKQVASYVSATRTETRTTTYGGPSGQTSRSEAVIIGPAIEANSQYFADKYAYCTQSYASACQPNGGCPMDGLYGIVLGRQITDYEYGPANEVVKTVTSEFRPRLAAAQPTDWRSGMNAGIPQDFNGNLNTTAQYLHQVTIREFKKEDNVSIQETTIYTSSASRGAGLGANLDAYAGIQTSETRKSSTTITNDLRPDTVNAPTTAVETGELKVTLKGSQGGYLAGFGPYEIKEDMPVPVLLETRAEIDEAVELYSDYLVKFTKGDSRGLSIAMALSEEVADAWAPNTPFRYYDPGSDTLMAMRMDSTTWGVDKNGCLFSTAAIWVNDLIGNVNVPNNLAGASTPVINGDQPIDDQNDFVAVTDDQGNVIGYEQPTATVSNEQITNSEMAWNVIIEIDLDLRPKATGENGIRTPPPEPEDVAIENTLVIWCTGKIVEPGALIELETNGAIPATAYGNPVVDALLVVNDDLFAEEESGGGEP